MFHDTTTVLMVVLGLVVTMFPQVLEVTARPDPIVDTKEKLLNKKLLHSLLRCVCGNQGQHLQYWPMETMTSRVKGLPFLRNGKWYMGKEPCRL